jgi:hypothetical protein
MKKMIGFLKFRVLFASAFFLLLPGFALADVGCGAAEIQLVGQHYPYKDPVTGAYSDITRVQLINRMTTSVGTWAPGTARYFFLHKEVGNPGLAVLLTASSLGRKVNVMIVGDTAVENSFIRWVYLGSK